MMNERLHGEGGFTMVLTLSVLVICVALSAVAFGAVVNDMPLRKEGKNRKAAYAAAEAGLNFYVSRLTQDNEYWAKCTTVPRPNASERSPVNQRWDGGGADPRDTRVVPGETSKYTVELLPAIGAECRTSDPNGTMLDAKTGTIRIRATGFAQGEKRSIVATLRRKSFLDYLYFTDYETTDPVLQGSNQTLFENSCGRRYRALRSPGCVKIRFSEEDEINGPLHTNDDILTCNGSTLGRSLADRIETGSKPGFKNDCGSSPPKVKGTFQAGVDNVPIPTRNDKVASLAVAPYILTGTNKIVLTGSSMTVTKGTTVQTLPLPPNGVISVRQGAGCAISGTQAAQNYLDSADCANVRVSGQYSSGLTIVSDKDIIVDGNLERTVGSDALLGLIADQWVRVYHPVANRRIDNGRVKCDNLPGTMEDVTIDAAILSLKHSFIVDNYDCGDELGTLKVTGAIAQTYRGPVGTPRPTGYTKSYNYDDRMRFRNPPYFLDPVSAAWRLVRSNEQTPAR